MWRSCSQTSAVAGSSLTRSPKTPRFHQASAPARQAKSFSRWLFRSGARAVPSSSRLSPRASRGASLWKIIAPACPEPHVGEVLLLSLLDHLLLEDREDQDVPALAVVAARAAEDALLSEAVPLERVDAEKVVGVHLRLHASQAERVHGEGQKEARGLDPPAFPEGAEVRHGRLEEGELLEEGDVVEAHVPDRGARSAERLDQQGQRGWIAPDQRGEVRVVGAEDPAEIEEVAADHLVQEGLVRPLLEERQVLQRGQADAQPHALEEGGQPHGVHRLHVLEVDQE